MSRETLLALGAPLQAAATSSEKSRKASPFFFFRSERVQARRNAVGQLNKAAVEEEAKRLTKEWREMSAELREPYVRQSQSSFDSKELQRQMQPPVASSGPSSSSICKPCLWGLNSQQLPLSREEFTKAAERVSGCSPGGALPGYRNYCSRLRDEMLPQVFVGEEGSGGAFIPPLPSPSSSNMGRESSAHVALICACAVPCSLSVSL